MAYFYNNTNSMEKRNKIVERVIGFEGEQDFILNPNKPDHVAAGEIMYVEAAGTTTERSLTQTLSGVQDTLAPVITTASPTRTDVVAPTAGTTTTPTGTSTPITTTTPTTSTSTTTNVARTDVDIPTKPSEPRVVTEVPIPTKPTEPRVVTEISFCGYVIDQFNLDVSGNQAAVNVSVKKSDNATVSRISLPSNGKIAYRLDGSAPVVTDSSFVLKNLSSGSHTITVSAVCDDGQGGVDISTATQTKTFTISPSTTTVTTTTTLTPPFRGGFGGGGGGGATEEPTVAPVEKKKQFPFLLLLLIAGGIFLYTKQKKN